MGYFDDFGWAVHTYPKHNVTLRIEDPETSGNKISVGEIFSFKVQASNTGPLNLKNVVLLISGTPFVEVTRSLSPPAVFKETLLSSAMSVGAGGDRSFGTYFGRAKKDTDSTAKLLVLVTFYTWEADLSNVLSSKASGETAQDSYTNVVYP